jgi:hypothetical protein
VEQKTVDTTGFAQFQNWKAQNELADATSYNHVAEAKSLVQTEKPLRYKSSPVRYSKMASSRPTRTGSGSRGSVGASNGTAMGSESSNTAKAPAKKRISKAAKGAVIGAAGGAVAGAVINKNNRTVGAVVGAVVGAGGGYVIGRRMDKKDGRYLSPGFAGN